MVDETAPKRIWLQTAGCCRDAASHFDDGVTWCTDCVDEGDQEYIRADLHEALKAEIGRLRAALEAAMDPAAAPAPMSRVRAHLHARGAAQPPVLRVPDQCVTGAHRIARRKPPCQRCQPASAGVGLVTSREYRRRATAEMARCGDCGQIARRGSTLCGSCEEDRRRADDLRDTLRSCESLDDLKQWIEDHILGIIYD